jgi:hypothetical protein
VLKQQLMALLDQQGSDISAEDAQVTRIEHCSYEEFRLKHLLCFDREITKLPPEQRTGHFLPERRTIMVSLDRQDRDLDALFARLKLQERQDGELAAIKGAKTFRELSAMVRSFCADRHAEPQIGMTESQVKMTTSWCYPTTFNETVTANHVSRQYVYHREDSGERWANGHEGYLYFTDGRLVAIQR